MQLTRLSWSNALNKLKAGVAPFTEYENEANNYFFIKDGQLFSGWRKETRRSSGPMLSDTFRLVEKPTYHY